MQLKLATKLEGKDINDSGVPKEMYDLLMDDEKSIELIAKNIFENEKIMGRKLGHEEAGFAHNMGPKRYQDYLDGVDKPPNDEVPKRSLEYTEAIKKTVAGEVDVRTNTEIKESNNESNK